MATDCPACSALLCPHGLCRVCLYCPQCDQVVIHPEPAGVRMALDHVRVSPNEVSHAASQLARRTAYLEECEIPVNQWEEASRAIDNLKSDCCQPGRCNRRKKPQQAFCSQCYRRLPMEVRDDLGLHLRAGYLAVYRRALAILYSAGQNQQPKP